MITWSHGRWHFQAITLLSSQCFIDNEIDNAIFFDHFFFSFNSGNEFSVSWKKLARNIKKNENQKVKEKFCWRWMIFGAILRVCVCLISIVNDNNNPRKKELVLIANDCWNETNQYLNKLVTVKVRLRAFCGQTRNNVIIIKPYIYIYTRVSHILWLIQSSRMLSYKTIARNSNRT